MFYLGIILVLLGNYIGVYLVRKNFTVGYKKGNISHLFPQQKKIKWGYRIVGMILLVTGLSLIIY